MNYYEHHIGDYAQATAHLSFVEDAAFSRLIRKYYATEKPLPADIKAVQRLVAARTREEKSAVETILGEFFILEDDGWHNARCDAEIARFIAGEPEREVKKANETNRLKRHREERAELFKRLTDAGQHAPWNISIIELREMVKRLDGNAPETPAPPLPETAPATPATATQTPDTRHQTPDLKPTPLAHASSPPTGGTRAGAASARMRATGLADANPMHPKLLALIDAGITDEELAQAATEAVQRGKGFAYALGVAEGRRRDAAMTPLPAPGPSPGRKRTLTETRIDTIAGLTGQTQNPQENPHERDITAHTVRIA